MRNLTNPAGANYTPKANLNENVKSNFKFSGSTKFSCSTRTFVDDLWKPKEAAIMPAPGAYRTFSEFSGLWSSLDSQYFKWNKDIQRLNWLKNLNCCSNVKGSNDFRSIWNALKKFNQLTSKINLLWARPIQTLTPLSVFRTLTYPKWKKTNATNSREITANFSTI